MKRLTLFILALFCCSLLAMAQEDVELLQDQNPFAAAGEPSEEDLEFLTMDDDSLSIGRFHQPIKFSREELNRIRDPRVRDDYWYALNDTTDKDRYLKVHYAFNKARDNWAFMFGFGTNTVHLMSMNSEFNVGPVIEFGFKKDLHPYWSARAMAQFSHLNHWLTSTHESTFIRNWEDRYVETGGIQTEFGWRQRVEYSSIVLRADVMLNLVNLFSGREKLYNPYDAFLYFGSGGTYSAIDLGQRDGSTFSPFWMGGFQQYFNFGRNNERFSFYVDLNASWQGDDIEGYSEQNSAFKFCLLTGLSFKFSDKIHFQRLGIEDNGSAPITNISDDGNDISTYVVTHRKDTIAHLPPDLIEAAFFQIDRVELAHTYVLNLGFYAKMMKNFPQQKFLVRGFADLEVGSLKRNLWLCQKRAEVVADVLIKTYGVDPDQIVMQAGDLNEELPFMREFGHHKFNRCVIVAPLEEEYQNVVNTTDFDDESELMDGRVAPRTPAKKVSGDNYIQNKIR